MRSAVAIYMAFVLTAGPSLCCCTTAAARAPDPGRDSQPLLHTTPTSSCCQHHQPARIDPATSAVPGHASGKPGSGLGGRKPGQTPCPCREQGSLKIDAPSPVTNAVDDVARFLTLAEPFVTAEILFTRPIDATRGSGTERVPLGHRCTAERLLDLHHMLRC